MDSFIHTQPALNMTSLFERSHGVHAQLFLFSYLQILAPRNKMCDDESFQRFGTPLPLLEPEEVPSKKPVYVQDQIVTDENGKRRFHGAFTGGFSAGYWNTVGSQEGWTPQSFKSSRSEKAPKRQELKPRDFMDDEDLGEFGIAPQQIQVREDFAADNDESRKRKIIEPSSGPIPGIPVLHQLLKPVKDKAAVRILKSWGWRPGQGIGPRLTRKEKKLAKERNLRELYLMQQYGYEPGEAVRKQNDRNTADSDEDDEDEDYDEDDDEITFAPDDYEPMLCKPKDNRYGLGYTGLSREPVLSQGKGKNTYSQHVNLFPSLELLDKSNKKFSIRGQAFGVGALEEEDDDIYERDDMSKYDFSTGQKQPSQKTKKKVTDVQDKTVLEGFALGTNPTQYNLPLMIDLPRDYKPRNWAERKSRFAPLDAEKAKILENFEQVSLESKLMTPADRGRLLGEEQATTSAKVEQPKWSDIRKAEREEKAKKLLEKITQKGNNFTTGGLITAEGEEKSKTELLPQLPEVQKEHKNILEKVTNKTKNLACTSTSGEFKPFLGNEAKQHRYEQFLSANLSTEEEIGDFLREVQPLHLSEWDREMEKKEFMQARNIYKPLVGMMSERFVSEATVEAEKSKPDADAEGEKKIEMKRTKTMWKPDPLLCKRYNIAEPFGGTMIETKPQRKSKLSVFDYLEGSINTKADFHTPVIIPKHIEKPQAIVRETQIAEPMLVVESSSSADLKNLTECNTSAPKLLEERPSGSKEVKPFKFVPKTDLEKRVEESKDKPIAEKANLFKAIFGDSDDDDDNMETSATTEAKKAETLSGLKPLTAAAANLLRNTSPPRGIFAALFSNVNKTEPAKEKTIDSKVEAAAATTVAGAGITGTISSTAVASTISPTTVPTIVSAKTDNTSQKEGEPQKITFKSRKERNVPEDLTSEVAYGPKLPDKLKTSHPVSAPKSNDHEKEDIDKKLLKLWEKVATKSKPLDLKEKWVEKTAAGVSSSDDTSDSDSSSSEDKSAHKKRSKKAKKKRKKSSKEHSKKHNKKNKKKSKRHNKKEHKNQKRNNN